MMPNLKVFNIFGDDFVAVIEFLGEVGVELLQDSSPVFPHGIVGRIVSNTVPGQFKSTRRIFALNSHLYSLVIILIN